MLISELIDRYIYTIPFVRAEITDDLMFAVWRDGINFYNKFDPLIKMETISVTSSNYTYLYAVTVVGETPVGVKNGVNKDFILLNSPVVSNSMHNAVISKDAITLVEGIDYIISGINLIMSIPPAINSTLLANYSYNGPAPEAVLRVYFNSLVFENRTENLCYRWQYRKPTITIANGLYDTITCYNRTLDDINLNEFNLLDAYIKQLLIIALGNKRRMAVITDHPIDGKGDQFVGDAVTEKQRLEEAILMLPPIHW